MAAPIPPTTETATYRGLLHKKVTTPKKLSASERIGCAAVGVIEGGAALLGTAATLGFGFRKVLLKDSVKKSFGEALSGVREEVAYEVSTEAPPRKEKYNPHSRDDLRRYVSENKSHLLTANGHQYILNKADSAIILLPNGDDKEIREIKFWDAETGLDIEDSSRLEKNVRAYLVGYDHIEKQLKTISDKTSLVFTHFKICFETSGMIRAYQMPRSAGPGSGNPGVAEENKMGLFSGIRINIPDDTWKEMENFFDHNKTKNKQNLQAEKVHQKDDANPLSQLFKNSPPPKSSPRPPPSDPFGDDTEEIPLKKPGKMEEDSGVTIEELPDDPKS